MNQITTTLDKLREQIDKIDEEILFLLKRRIQTTKKILKYKVDNNLEIKQNKREFEIITTRCAKGKVMNLDEKFVNELFTLILEESNRIEEKHKEEAKFKSRIR